MRSKRGVILKFDKKGFTLIELVMVIVILSILGAVAIPQFVNLQTEAGSANESGVAGGVRAGILTYFIDPARGNRTAYPGTLDTATAGVACSTTNPCFTTVLSQGGITDQWSKLSIITIGGAPAYRSGASATNVWLYDSTTGNFRKTAN